MLLYGRCLNFKKSDKFLSVAVAALVSNSRKFENLFAELVLFLSPNPYELVNHYTTLVWTSDKDLKGDF